MDRLELMGILLCAGLYLITGIAGSCALAASDQATVAPPRSAIRSWRRRKRSLTNPDQGRQSSLGPGGF
jgi:hypothetical protein